jgi:hypothetical protein
LVEDPMSKPDAYGDNILDWTRRLSCWVREESRVSEETYQVK